MAIAKSWWNLLKASLPSHNLLVPLIYPRQYFSFQNTLHFANNSNTARYRAAHHYQEQDRTTFEQ
jgi:hypothetical protein